MTDKEHVRLQILQAASRLFEKFGPAKTSLADIAREMRMSPANLYNFFASKDALLEAVGQLHMSSLRTQLLLDMESIGDPWQRIKTLFITVAEDVATRLKDEKDLLQIQASARKNDWKFIDDFDSFVKAIVEAQLRLLIAERVLVGIDPAEAATALFDCVSGTIRPLAYSAAKVNGAERRLRLLAQIKLLERAFH